jgi:hypothetical protein
MSRKIRTVLLWMAMSAMVPVMITGCESGPSTKEPDKRVIEILVLAFAGIALARNPRGASGRFELKPVIG